LRIPALGYDEVVLEGATQERWPSARLACSVGRPWENQETWYLQGIAPVGSNHCNPSHKVTRSISNGLTHGPVHSANEPIPWRRSGLCSRRTLAC